MNLLQHLHIATPLVWCETFEPERATDIVITHSLRPVFRLDPFKGLVVWKDEEWKQVLVDKGGEYDVVYDMQVALKYVLDEKGVLLVYFAHKIAEDLLGLLSGLFSLYRHAVHLDDLNQIPAQFILLSNGNECPPELSRHIALCDLPLPSAEHLAEVVAHIKVHANEVDPLPQDVDVSKIVRSGLGLTENEFVQTCLVSMHTHGLIDAEYINNYKRNKLKRGGTLDIRTPKISFDDVGGLDLAKEVFMSAAWAWQNPEEAEEFGVHPLHRVLLIGVQGGGKSLLCEAVAKTLGLDLAKTGIAQNMNMFIGESERRMRETFWQLRALAPIVAWMDELGRELSGSGRSFDSGTTDRVHGEFLTGIQELPDDVFLVGAANRIDSIPPEMLRAGRFDKIMFVGFPSLEERKDIFRIHLGDLAENFDLEVLAKHTPVWTGAEIAAMIEEQNAIVTYSQRGVASRDRRRLNEQDLMTAIPNFKNRLWLKHRQDLVEMYRRALVEWDWASSAQLEDAQDIIHGNVATPLSGKQSNNATFFQFS